MPSEGAPKVPGRTIKQERSRKTYAALVAAGFRLLQKNEFESLTIAGICDSAGYSVGAFYARFQSKDEFFKALVDQHIRDRVSAHEQLFASASRDDLIDTLIDDLVTYYWRRRGFWRAVLMRSAQDSEFFAPINRHGKSFVKFVTKRLQSDLGRSFTRTERENLKFALHMVLAMINNRIVNRPRPSLIGHSSFVHNLTRAFRLVSDHDNLMRTAQAQ
ncbi:MAG: TetR/AcrR family transcriptional regulator [Gammaproteobacteria bacterium]|jgi:AcrR family transcriptional regulator